LKDSRYFSRAGHLHRNNGEPQQSKWKPCFEVTIVGKCHHELHMPYAHLFASSLSVGIVLSEQLRWASLVEQQGVDGDG
jgi:hypothetical protein